MSEYCYVKCFFTFVVFYCLATLNASATHVRGGEIFYTYLGRSIVDPNNDSFRITVRLFRKCPDASGVITPDLPTLISVSFNNQSDGLQVQSEFIDQTSLTQIYKREFNCINNPPIICFDVGLYIKNITLTRTLQGYTARTVGCCRINGITNVTVQNQSGYCYITKIPGSDVLADYEGNSSPEFELKDSAIVCRRNYFTLPFSANDSVDHDQLRYFFHPGLNSTGSGVPGSSGWHLQYNTAAGYTATQPLGNEVFIDSSTGVISGIAPGPGLYVVSVRIDEYRRGIKINEHFKDFILNIASCDIASANLPPNGFVACVDSTAQFYTLGQSGAVNTYLWQFNDPNLPTASSNLPTPNYKYSDTGVFTVRLTVNAGQRCSNSNTTKVFVAPSIKPAFSAAASCPNSITRFFDSSSVGWPPFMIRNWNFGDISSNTNSSQLVNPTHVYTQTGTYSVSLFLQDAKGCEATTIIPITITDRAGLILPFRDTLLCRGDTMQLSAIANGNLTWTPSTYLSNPTAANPNVWPPVSTTFYVDVLDNVCTNRDSIKVNVISSIQVNAGNDTIICKTDFAFLNANGMVRNYAWNNSSLLNNATIKNPKANPNVTTDFIVTSRLGSCVAKDTVRVKVVPYPFANAGVDDTLCFNADGFLNGSMTGSRFNWSPTVGIQSQSLRTVVKPTRTTNYILTVTDTLGCPKAVSDTVLIVVSPKLNTSITNDTTITIGQPLQLFATGGVDYLWSPNIGLNKIDSANPIALFTNDPQFDEIIYKVKISNSGRCFAFEDVKVKIWKTGPDIFIPTAFSPNGDGKNDIMRPIAVGMKRFDYFRIYNRWGQLIFASNDAYKGWNGYIDGAPQETGTYMVTAAGIRFDGKEIIKKQSFILIR
jgi:gliding motility-associated-like protein